MNKCIIALAIYALSFNCFAKTIVTTNDSIVKLSNNRISVEFAGKNAFDIKSLILSSAGELVTPGSNKLPWAITYKGKQGQVPEMTTEFAEYTGYTLMQKSDTSKTIAFHWNTTLNYDGNKYPVTMYATLGDNSSLLEWNLEAKVPEGWTVTKFSFPKISIRTPKKGEIITPAGWGNLFELEPNGIYTANYPSWSASMQMIMMNDANGGFYYSGEDLNACGKLFKASEISGNVVFTTEATASEGWTKDGLFKLPWKTTIGHNPNGWEAAAMQWYRPFSFTTEWGSVPFNQRNIPEWLKNKDLWFRVKSVDEEAVGSADKAIDYFGENLFFHWYWWHHFPYDSHYPDYFPAKPGFASIVKHIQEKNCHITPYINGRLWDPSADSYESRNGKDASCRNTDGTLYTELYPTSKVPNTVTCPASPIWHDMIIELCSRIQNELGTNGVYIDQIAAAAPYPCYAENHNHPKGGGEFWYHAYRDMIKDLRKDYVLPGNIIFSEENSECFIPSFDILLTLNTPHDPKRKIVPLYPMIYSDRVITAGYTYVPGTDVTTGAFRHINMQCFLYGSQLGWIEPRFIWNSDKNGTESKFLKKLSQFRKNQHEIFNTGRYLSEYIPEGDNPTTYVPTFGTDYFVKGAKWLLPNGKEVLFLVNSDEKSHIVKLPNGKDVKLAPLSVSKF